MSDFHRNLVAKKLENQTDKASRQFHKYLPVGLLGEDLGELPLGLLHIYHQINKYIYVENKYICKGGKVIPQANTPRAPEGPGADPEVCTTKYRQKWPLV